MLVLLYNSYTYNIILRNYIWIIIIYYSYTKLITKWNLHSYFKPHKNIRFRMTFNLENENMFTIEEVISAWISFYDVFERRLLVQFASEIATGYMIYKCNANQPEIERETHACFTAACVRCLFIKHCWILHSPSSTVWARPSHLLSSSPGGASESLGPMRLVWHTGCGWLSSEPPAAYPTWASGM